MNIEDEINKGNYFRDADGSIYLFFPVLKKWRAWKYNQDGLEELEFSDVPSILKDKKIESRPGWEVEHIIERILDDTVW